MDACQSGKQAWRQGVPSRWDDAADYAERDSQVFVLRLYWGLFLVASGSMVGKEASYATAVGVT